MQLQSVKDTAAKQADYMVQQITHVVNTFGARDSGSEGETKGMEYMAEVLKPLADEVTTEPFEVHPAAFMGWIYASVTMMLASFVCMFFVPVASLVLLVLAMALMVGEFVCYFQIVDKFAPKKTSHCVTAIKHPVGEVKRRIMFTGHTDAAAEWTINAHLGGKWFIAHFLVSIVGVLYVFGVSLAALIYGAQAGVWAGIMATSSPCFIPAVVGLVFVPMWILMYDLWNEKLIAPGANDDLTGTFLSIAILKALKDSGVQLENTEVGVVLCGSEEAGLRGAKAWCKAHAEQYKADEAKGIATKFVVFDTITEEEFFMTNVKDLNGFVPSDKTVCKMVNDAFKAEDVKNTPNGTVPLGATDSAAFNQAGLDAVAVTAMNHELPKYYHTRHDTPDLLSPSCLEKAFKVAVRCIEDFDDGKYDKQ